MPELELIKSAATLFYSIKTLRQTREINRFVSQNVILYDPLYFGGRNN